MTAPAYELIDRYLWINAAASSIELTENELLSISQIADNMLYEPLLDFNSITDRETADRTVAKILSRLDNPHLSANFDNYLNEYIRLKKMGSQNKIIETMTYYIYEFFRIAEIYFNGSFSSPAPHLHAVYENYIQSLLQEVSHRAQTSRYCPQIATPYQQLPWHRRLCAHIFPDASVKEIKQLSDVCRKTYESIHPVWCKLSAYKNKLPDGNFDPWQYIRELAALPYDQASAKVRADYQAAEQQKKDLELNATATGQKLKLAILNRIKLETVSALLHAKIIRHFDEPPAADPAIKISQAPA